MNVYVTKYALSGGVTYEEGELWGDHGKYFRPAGHKHRMLIVGRDCFANRADAVAKVAEMQAKKVASLAKQVAAVKKLHPEEVVPMEAA